MKSKDAQVDTSFCPSLSGPIPWGQNYSVDAYVIGSDGNLSSFPAVEGQPLQLYSPALQGFSVIILLTLT